MTRAHAHAHLRKVIVAAEALGVEVVGTFAGRDKARGLKQNLARFAELWPPLVDFAGEHDVKLAIENCPMIFSDDEWPGGTNLAYCPAAWREMFALVDRDNFGLNFDPSHLVWQFIDYERAVYVLDPGA
jgi:sugar phosphate isomerase/epimerase